MRHRKGWCALKPLRRVAVREPKYHDNEETQCDHFITLPGGYEYRRPDCAECIAALEKKNG